MLSRIADSLYWMNRYMERSDVLLRTASIQYILGMDKDISGTSSWKPVLQLFTYMEEDEITAIENDTEATLKKLLADPENENSLRMIINRARENARGAQDHLTKEVWEEINQIFHFVNNPSILTRLDNYQVLPVIKELTTHTVCYAGTVDITMPRGNGWYFMNLGRYVERCLQSIALIQKQLDLMNFSENDTNDILQWRQLLLSLSGYEMHLKTYRSSNYNYNVVHQVLINENFPHSVLYSLRQINHYLDRVTSNYKTNASVILSRSFGRVYSKVRYMDLSMLSHLTVQDFLAEVKTELFRFTIQLEQHFFSYA